MKPTEKTFRQRIGLSALFSAIVFVILLISSLLIVAVGLLLIQTGTLNLVSLARHRPLLPVTFLLILSVVVGTVVAFIVSRYPLKPVRRVIDATNRLAAGDFSARLHLPATSAFSELETSFNRMAEELGSTELLRSDFVDQFSHEFKTPIVSIRGFAAELQHDDLTPEQRAEYLDIILAESGRLAALATNVLNLSRVEKQVILNSRAVYNLSEQVRRSVLLFQSQWEKRGLDLTVELEEVSVYAEEELLSQVWVNLIENAIKFTPEGGSVEISLKKEGAFARFTIQDDGYGIPEDVQKHIFDKFYQGDLSRATAGNGLGLSIARRVVELHGGSISVCSAEGAGAAFTVLLPLAEK